MADRFVVGDTVTLTNTFKVSGTATDPTTISLVVTDPTGTATTYTYAGSTITRTSTGLYTKNITASTAGLWSYTWTGTGAAADVESGSFDVHPVQPPTAPSVDILTLVEAKRALNMSADDLTRIEVLTAAITAVSQTLDEVCGPIMARTITSERCDGGDYCVTLRHWPVVSVSSVVEYSGTSATTLTEETAGTAPASGYLLEPYSGLANTSAYTGLITRRSGGYDYPFAAGRRNVVVTYSAGRFTTNNSATNGGVTEQFKHAARLTLENWWQQFRDSIATVGEFETPVQSFPRFAVPAAARQLLGGEVHDDPVRLG